MRTSSNGDPTHLRLNVSKHFLPYIMLESTVFNSLIAPPEIFFGFASFLVRLTKQALEALKFKLIGYNLSRDFSLLIKVLAAWGLPENFPLLT